MNRKKQAIVQFSKSPELLGLSRDEDADYLLVGNETIEKLSVFGYIKMHGFGLCRN